MIEFVTDALACHRLTRLIVDDSVFDRPRHEVKQYLHDTGHPKLVELLGCSWCVSVYVGFGIAAARRIAPRVWSPAGRALALSSVAGAVSALVA